MLFKIISWLSLIKSIVSIVYTCDLLNQSITNMPILRGSYSRTLRLDNFNSFSEIKIKCNTNIENLFTLELLPNIKLILNQELNLTGLIMNDGYFINIYISNINAIEINTDASFGLEKHNDFRTIYLDYSNFEFYLNNKPFDVNDCLNYKFRTNFFTKIDVLNLRAGLFYNKKVCPILLSNSRLSQMSIYGIANSFVNKNKFEFVDIGEELGNDVYLGSFQYLDLLLTYCSVTKQIVNQYVFRSMESIYIEGLINEVEFDFFKFFKRLIRVELILQRINSFFANGNHWFDHLATDKKTYDLENISDSIKYKMSILVLFINDNSLIFGKNYDYPEEDFCLFYHFPHDRLVYPIVDPGMKINCSCTVIWLLTYTFLFYHDLSPTNEYLSYAGPPKNPDFAYPSTVYCLFLPNMKINLRTV